jgi:TFIIF-interacting CTD phosphatase-like protein
MFIKSKAQRHYYNVHILTAGTQEYADAVKKVIDPYNTIHGAVKSCRDEDGIVLPKRLSMLGIEKNLDDVVIFDDFKEAWVKEERDQVMV